MAKKKLKFCVVDTETATLPFANDIAGDDAEKKKRIGMAREEYWQNKTDLEHALRDYEEEKISIQSKINHV